MEDLEAAPHESMIDDNSNIRLQERFVRWQEALRQSLAGHVALIVAFASGGLGFVGAILNADQAHFSGITALLILSAGSLFLISLLLALWISLNRLKDIRQTLEILKRRRDGSAEDIVKKLQAQTDALGKRTWKLVYLQLFVFMLAAAVFSAGLYTAFDYKLFPRPIAPAQSSK
jgi:hypothetical protein